MEAQQGLPATGDGDVTQRVVPLEMSPETFRTLGYRMVDRVAEFLSMVSKRPVTTDETPQQVWSALGAHTLPEHGVEPAGLLERTADLLFDHSLLNGHPRFWGYVTSSAAPIGALGDMLAAAVNPNVGAWALAPMATAIEGQTVRWIAELIGYRPDCGGILVSGGNMANFVGFLAARRAKTGWDVRTSGMAGAGSRHLRLYTSRETHTWVQKAADLFGLGTDAIRWITPDDRQRMDVGALRQQIQADLDAGDQPFLVVGTAGTVSTGAIDPLPELATVCREHDLWLHVDGAYGGLAAVVPDASADLRGLAAADSIAIDPHKWLYAPLEAGCILVRDASLLRDTFSFHPPYYHFDEQTEEAINYYELGPQNSRGFRALKVWLGLQQAGRAGYATMIADDIRLAQELYQYVDAQPDLEACTQGLSITTFRFVPVDLRTGTVNAEMYLNELNEALLERLQAGGEAFVSNAIIGDMFVLRACIVNFRTTRDDIAALPHIVVRLGRELDAERRPSAA